MKTNALLTDLTPKQEEKVSGGLIPLAVYAAFGVGLSVGRFGAKKGWW